MPEALSFGSAPLQVVASGQSATVVVVEDEPVTRALIGGSLRAAGFDVTCVESGGGLRAMGDVERVDLVLLDIELPDDDGYDLAAWLRERSEAGLIFVTRRTSTRDRVRGLDLGADDFIVKPIDIDELIARARAVLRRRRPRDTSGGGRTDAARARFAGWSFDAARFELTSPEGDVVALTPGEASLLERLVAARGGVVARAELQEALAGESAGAASRSLDVIVHRLRRKLGEGGAVVPRVLLTVHGVGYRLALEPA